MREALICNVLRTITLNKVERKSKNFKAIWRLLGNVL